MEEFLGFVVLVLTCYVAFRAGRHNGRIRERNRNITGK